MLRSTRSSRRSRRCAPDANSCCDCGIGWPPATIRSSRFRTVAADSTDTLADRSRGRVSLPEKVRSPWWELGRRMLAALAILVGTVLIVWFDRHSYHDNNDPTGAVGMVDAIYYTTVTLSTTGYGDIASVSEGARLNNACIISPLRIAFFVLLIVTTLEVLGAQGREIFRVSR